MQTIDHSYASCLNFAANFDITCKSLTKPLPLALTTEEYYSDPAILAEAFKCKDVTKSECLGDCINVKESECSSGHWTSYYTEAVAEYNASYSQYTEKCEKDKTKPCEQWKTPEPKTDGTNNIMGDCNECVSYDGSTKVNRNGDHWESYFERDKHEYDLSVANCTANYQ